MKKPRIIIADTDHEYTLTLQFKFAQEYFEVIEIEIITDREYFNTLFSTPQSADVLIVSDDLYDGSIKRHNISNIFVMMEYDTTGATEDLNIHRMYKYTSVNDIFNKIVGESRLYVSPITKKDPQIIVVYSASGGVGKTTIALGISACLQKNYKRVLYINAARMQTFQHYMKDSSPISSTEIYARLNKLGDNTYDEIKNVIRSEGFDYLPPFKAALMSLGLNYSVYEKIATSARKSNRYDYIIVDCDTAFDEEKASLLSTADQVLIILNQTEASVYATNVLVNNINGINGDKYLFLCNNFDDMRRNAMMLDESSLRFSVNEYIDHFVDCDSMKCEEISAENGIQKAAFLVV